MWSETVFELCDLSWSDQRLHLFTVSSSCHRRQLWTKYALRVTIITLSLRLCGFNFDRFCVDSIHLPEHYRYVKLFTKVIWKLDFFACRAHSVFHVGVPENVRPVVSCVKVSRWSTEGARRSRAGKNEETPTKITLPENYGFGWINNRFTVNLQAQILIVPVSCRRSVVSWF